MCVRWTGDQLSKHEREYLFNLDLKIQYKDIFSLSHSTFCYPELFDFIQTIYEASMSFKALTTPIGFIGHSHVPMVFFAKDEVTYSLEQEFSLDLQTPTIINIGSVGQPRDGNPLSCCGIYDDTLNKFWIHRVEYDIEKAIDKIKKTNVLPHVSGERLRHGR